MNGLKFYDEDIEEVVSDKDKYLIIKFKKTENSRKLKFALLKQFAGDHLDKN